MPQAHEANFGKLVFEINEIFEARPLKAENCLFLIAYYEKIRVSVVTGQKLKSPVLRAVCVLMLIHKYVLVFFLKVQKKVFVFLQNFYGLKNHILKIVELPAAQFFLVQRVSLRELHVFIGLCQIVRTLFCRKTRKFYIFLLAFN